MSQSPASNRRAAAPHSSLKVKQNPAASHTWRPALCPSKTSAVHSLRLRALVALLWGASTSVGCGGGAPPPAQPEVAAEPASQGPTSAAGQPDLTSKLNNEQERSATVRKLISQFDEAAANGTQTEEAQAFIAKYVGPLTDVYVQHSGSLEPKLRSDLLNLLVSFDHPRAAPAHAAALRNYKNERKAANEAIWACQFAQKHKSPELQSALLEALSKVDITSDDGMRFSTHLLKAMQHNATASWTAVLAEKLRAPLEHPEQFTNKKAIQKFNNQQFQQTAAAEVLGEISSENAARPLFEVLLTNQKHEIQPYAQRSLLQIGKPSVKLAHGLLAGSDSSLVELSRQSRKDLKEPNVLYAVGVIDAVAHPSSVEPVTSALKRTNDPTSRVLLALSLSHLPSSKESVELFREVYGRTPITLTLPRGESALEALAQTAPNFFDPSLTEWLGQKAAHVPGKGSRKGDVQRALIVSLSHLATAEQLPKVRTPAQRYGGRTGTPAYDAAIALAEQCKDNVGCYLKVASTPSNQDHEQLNTVLKSLTMVGVWGGAKERDALLDQLSVFKQPESKLKLARVLDKLTPENDPKVIAKLEKYLAAHEDPKTQSEFALRRLMYRIRAR